MPSTKVVEMNRITLIIVLYVIMMFDLFSFSVWTIKLLIYMIISGLNIHDTDLTPSLFYAINVSWSNHLINSYIKRNVTSCTNIVAIKNMFFFFLTSVQHRSIANLASSNGLFKFNELAGSRLEKYFLHHIISIYSRNN